MGGDKQWNKVGQSSELVTVEYLDTNWIFILPSSPWTITEEGEASYELEIKKNWSKTLSSKYDRTLALINSYKLCLLEKDQTTF